MVRAEINDLALKESFDRWYEDEHVPLALGVLNPCRYWRYWSKIEPQVHYVLYEFDDVDRACSVTSSPEMRELGQHFDQQWGDRVKRARDVLEVCLGPHVA
jgi:hypothetical protein